MTDDRIINHQPEPPEQAVCADQEIVADRPVVLVVETDPSTRPRLVTPQVPKDFQYSKNRITTGIEGLDELLDGVSSTRLAT